MARVLIVGGGDRARRLAASLVADGLAVRATSEDRAELPAIAACGAEAVTADPGRIASLMEPLAAVTVVCWLMGDPGGGDDRAAALHGDRLRMLLEKLVDTPVRGVVYEAAGPLPDEVYARGRATLAAAAATWALPVEVVDVAPAPVDGWLVRARAAVARLLAPGGPDG